jgi:uncharacterized membrane protein (UPF0127 family)
LRRELAPIWHPSVTYRFFVGSLRAAVAAIAAIAALFVAAAVGGATERATKVLRLDGVPFSPELAVTSAQRSLGLMHRKRAPKDGMLFVFPYDTTGGFWMKNTLVPLTIVFFNADGRRVRKLSMTPCRQESCPVYDPRRRYRFALELRASDIRPAAKLGPLTQLRRLSRRAS